MPRLSRSMDFRPSVTEREPLSHFQSHEHDKDKRLTRYLDPRKIGAILIKYKIASADGTTIMFWLWQMGKSSLLLQSDRITIRGML